MLSKAENELLTRIGPGTPMGNLVRQYWIPVMLSEELAEADGAPLRVRLLCEDLIMFRDTSGRVGLLEDHCAHRGASLFFGRNEEDGLRCVYHGWKYDVAGNCVDMPNEPPETCFKEKIHHKAYPCVEYGGMIWTYMGPRRARPAAVGELNTSDPVPEGSVAISGVASGRTARDLTQEAAVQSGPGSGLPELPKLEWAAVPAEHRNLSPVLRECNWVQALEGDIDTAHLYFLHARLNSAEDRGPQNDNGVFHEDRHPRLHLVDKPYGLVYGAQRDEGPDKYYWRITQFMFPFHTFFPPGGFSGVPGHIWVPLDDYHTMVWSVSWNPIEPLTRRQQWSRPDASQYLPATSDGMGRWRSPINKGNDYMIDRELQRTKTFTGVPSIPMQDQAVTESMGPVYDRSQEHLGSTDAMIMQVRRKLIEAAKALEEEGVTPPCVDEPELYGIRSASLILDRKADWTEETKELLKAFNGLPVATA